MEERLLWEYMHRPSDSFSVEVEALGELEEQILVESCHPRPWKQLPAESEGLVHAHHGGGPFMPYLSADLSSSAIRVNIGEFEPVRLSVNKFLDEWDVHISWHDLPCVSLPEPIYELIRQGSWKHLIFRSGGSKGPWKLIHDLLPPAFAARVPAPGAILSFHLFLLSHPSSYPSSHPLILSSSRTRAVAFDSR